MNSLSRARSTWLEVMLEALNRYPPVMPWERLSEMLAEHLEAPVAGDFGWDAEGNGKVRAYPLPDWFDLTEVALRAPSLHPIARQYASTQSRPVLTTTTVDSAFPREVQVYMAELREVGIDEQLWIPVSSLPDGPQIIGVCRGDSQYSQQELELAEFAQRVVVPIHRHVAALSGMRAVQWLECAQDLRLTPRQVSVLQLAAEGLTSDAIGRRLHLSPRTVHRHLENAYRRLHANDRVTAIRRAETAGLLQARGAGQQVPFASAQVPTMRGATHTAQS